MVLDENTIRVTIEIRTKTAYTPDNKLATTYEAETAFSVNTQAPRAQLVAILRDTLAQLISKGLDQVYPLSESARS